MKRSFFFRSALFFVACLVFFTLKTASAYITTLSAPAVSRDTRDQNIYFRGPNNLFYKVASDNPEIEIASDDSPTWVDYDVTAAAATRLGPTGILTTPATIISTPSVPGDGNCYFQDDSHELSKVNIDGTGYIDMGVRTSFAPVVPGDGYAYYFTDIDRVTGRSILGAYPRLYKILAASQGGREALALSSDLGQWGISSPCVPGDGYVYFQGIDHRLLKIPTTGAPPGGAISFSAGMGLYVATLSTPDVSGGRIFFPRGTDTMGGPYSTTVNILSFIDLAGTNLYSSIYNTTITPYFAPNGYLYFVDPNNEVFEFDMNTGTATDLYIQALSTPTGRLNSDGSLTLIYQAANSILTTYTVYH